MKQLAGTLAIARTELGEQKGAGIDVDSVVRVLEPNSVSFRSVAVLRPGCRSTPKPSTHSWRCSARFEATQASATESRHGLAMRLPRIMAPVIPDRGPWVGGRMKVSGSIGRDR